MIKNYEKFILIINQTIDTINKNISEELFLEELSSSVGISPFHFHRIFKHIIKEPINKYILRIRLEKAAFLLIYNQNKSITDIAFDCGFSSSQFFSVMFKKYFNKTPSQWKKNKYFKSSKKVEELNEILNYNFDKYNLKELNILNNLIVEIRNIESIKVAYTRNITNYKGKSDIFKQDFENLFSWGEENNLINENTKRISLYDDIYFITDDDQLRVTNCISIPWDAISDKKMNTLVISGGKYIVASCEVSENEFEIVWDYLYGKWIIKNSYTLADKPSFEVIKKVKINNISASFEVEMYIPIEEGENE